MKTLKQETIRGLDVVTPEMYIAHLEGSKPKVP
jgi:hypothetical protein